MRRRGNGTLQQKSNRRESSSPRSATRGRDGNEVGLSGSARLALLLLRVRRRGPEVDRDARLVTDDPGVVPGFDPSHVARTNLNLGPVVHRYAHPTRQGVQEVRRLAALSFRERLHVLRPAPPGSNVPRSTVPPPMLMTSACPLSTNGLISSGESKSQPPAAAAFSGSRRAANARNRAYAIVLKSDAGSPQSRINRAIARQSSPIVAFVEHACHAGGRGFESRRSRLSKCLQ
jgi:hypothetical protein